jgi:hypothetical protein
MPIQFDQSLQYQFALFFDDNNQEPTPAELREIPEAISKPVPGIKFLGLKLGSREQALRGGAPVPLPVLLWKSGSGVWRLTWAPDRLDLYFDAAGFAQILEGDASKPPEFQDVIARVSSNLAVAAKLSTRVVNRLALIWTGKSSCEGVRPATEIVARRFFAQPTIEAVGAFLAKKFPSD